MLPSAILRFFRVVAWLLPVAWLCGSGRVTRASDADTPESVAAASQRADNKSKKKHRKKKKKKKKQSTKAPNELESSARAGLGFVHGRKTRDFDSLELAAGLRFRYLQRLGDFTFKVPLSLEHLEPLSEPLRQSTGQLGLEASWRLASAVRPQLAASVLGVWRPDWPDLYQPQADGTLARTDRHSYWKREAELGLLLRPLAKNHARLKYRYAVAEYVQDPNFEPVERPNHLTPSNNVEHSITAAWRTRLGDSNVGASLEAYRRHYLYIFARDRFTGLTHAGPGGPPPNPLQEYSGWVPELSAKVALSSRFVLRPSASVTFNRDTFQGYYSYTEPELRARLQWQAYDRVELSLGLGLSLRRYGADSYREGGNHPPLDFGSRRSDRRGEAALDVAIRLGKRFSLVLENDVTRRETNFPDYVPQVFPAGADYDIDWDYTNVSSMLFVQVRIL